MATTDLNGDGYFDLVVPVETAKNLSADQGHALKTRNGLEILLGSGNGKFQKASGSPVQFPVKALPPHLSLGFANAVWDLASIDLAIGDWNGDGHVDLADVGGWPDQPISVLLGDGKGGFENSKAAQRELVGGDRAFRVHTSLAPTSADFNGDGHPDIASAYGYVQIGVGTGEWQSGIASATGYVLLGDGTGGFKPAPSSPKEVGDSPVAIASADFNADGHPDLAVADRASVRVLLDDGTTGFKPAPNSPLSTGGASSSLAVSDFNGDGHADIAVSDRDSGDVRLFLGDGKGGFKPVQGSPFKLGLQPASMATGDFNGDGRSDIATAAYWFDGIDEWDSVTVLLGNGQGGFSQAAGSPYATKKSSLPQASDPIFNAASVVAADFNGDGRDDLAVTGSQTGGVTVLLGRCR